MDPASAAPAAQPGVDGRALLVANFGYGPNARGAEWLLRTVWPTVRASVPTAALACVGGRGCPSTSRVWRLRRPGWRCAASSPTSRRALREAAVVLAPILEGGGTRLKVVEAWSQGKAVVATTKAIEGLPASSRRCRDRRRARGVRGPGRRPADRRRASAGDGQPCARAVRRAAHVGRCPAGGRGRLGHRQCDTGAGGGDAMSAPPGRVLIVGEFGAGALAVAYARAFEALGWQTTRYDMQAGYTRGAVLARARGLRRLLRPLLWSIMARETAALAARAELDLVLAIKAPYLGAGGLARLRGATSAPLAMLYPDSPYGAYVQRRGLPAVLARFDRVYIWSRQLSRTPARRRRRRRHVPAVRLRSLSTMRRWARWPRPECGRRHAIAFIGQRYDKRARWLAALRGLDVGVWGLGWEGDSTLRESGACVHRAAAHGAAAAAIYRGATRRGEHPARRQRARPQHADVRDSAVPHGDAHRGHRGDRRVLRARSRLPDGGDAGGAARPGRARPRRRHAGARGRRRRARAWRCRTPTRRAPGRSSPTPASAGACWRWVGIDDGAAAPGHAGGGGDRPLARGDRVAAGAGRASLPAARPRCRLWAGRVRDEAGSRVSLGPAGGRRGPGRPRRRERIRGGAARSSPPA